MAAVGAGILWLGWNGFNGGDPYFAGADASMAVINTNLTTACALLTWVIWDMLASKQKKPTFLGAINGMITGLVAITPAAGYVNSFGALIIGVVASTLVWFSWNYLSKVWIFKKVDDTLGVVYTHGIAGLAGGLLVGFLADPNVIVYLGLKGAANSSYNGLFYGNPKLVAIQLGAAATVIVWDAFITFLILRILGLFMKLRLPDEELEIGDVSVHDEEAYPDETLVTAAAAAAPAKATTFTTAEAEPTTG
jgi:Amt family ammonium transporter